MTNYRRRKPKPKEVVRKFVTNDKITATEVRLIGEDGNFIAIMSMEEARELADEQGKDLVEINPKAEPPVIKLIEFTKFKYQQEKSEKKVTKPNDEVKVLRVSVRISPHDLLVQSKKADEFIRKGNKAKLQVQLQRREKAYPELATETMNNFIAAITEPYTFENPPKMVGDSVFAIIKPKKI